MGAGSLGALLISYCLRLGIPMPRFATKQARVEADAVLLMRTVEYE